MESLVTLNEILVILMFDRLVSESFIYKLVHYLVNLQMYTWVRYIFIG